MQHGDFSSLAKDYALYRPGYSSFVRELLLRLSGGGQPVVADVGAGTGIWSRMLCDVGCKVTAVEPNQQMREEGIKQSAAYDITWVGASAEATTLKSNTYDLVCMASSFHWPDFDTACQEFCRILKPGGFFCALWNTRFIENNPLLVEVESYLKELVPDMKRVSSGRSEFCQFLTERLANLTWVEDVLYAEGRHTEQQSPDRYIGLWKSVNDVRVQAGAERFDRFLAFVESKVNTLASIAATYKTVAWIAKKK